MHPFTVGVNHMIWKRFEEEEDDFDYDDEE